MAAWSVLERTASARADADDAGSAGNAGSSEAATQESGRVTVIARGDPPTPPNMRFSASGG